MLTDRLTELVVKGSRTLLTKEEATDFMALFYLVVNADEHDMYTVYSVLGVEMYVWIDFALINATHMIEIRKALGQHWH